MHNVADISGAILNMVLQSEIVCCERCWCDMKLLCDMVRNDGVTWNVVGFGINVRDGQCLTDVEHDDAGQCKKCGGMM